MFSLVILFHPTLLEGVRARGDVLWYEEEGKRKEDVFRFTSKHRREEEDKEADINVF